MSIDVHEAQVSMTDSHSKRNDETEVEAESETESRSERLANAAQGSTPDQCQPHCPAPGDREQASSPGDAHAPPVDLEIELELVVVRYEDASNRCTLLPRECSEEAGLTTWLSANEAAFVDRLAMR